MVVRVWSRDLTPRGITCDDNGTGNSNVVMIIVLCTYLQVIYTTIVCEYLLYIQVGNQLAVSLR